MKMRSLLVFAALSVSLFCAAAFADDVDSYVRYMPSRPIKEGPGKIGIIHSGFEYSHEFKVFGKMPLEVSLDTQYIGINKTIALELPSRLTVTALDIEATLPFFNLEHTYFRVGVTPSFYGDNWNCDSAHFRIPNRYYAVYQPNDQWTWVLGIAVFPDYENVLYPMAGLIYKPNDRWTFNMVPDDPNISYRLNDKMTLFVEGNLTFEEFVVQRDPSTRVVLRYAESHVTGGIKYKLNKFVQASFSAGAVLDNTLKYRDSQGKAAVRDGFYSEFRLEAEF